ILRRPRNDKYNTSILIADNLTRNLVNRTKHVELFSNVNITAIDPTKIELIEDSIKITNYDLVKDTLDNKKFIIRYNWKKEKNYTLNIDEGAFIGYFQA